MTHLAYSTPSAPVSLYVHIPFCETKCPYCDFNTFAGIESLIPEYVAALRSEIDLWGRILRGPDLATIFFGGGTPSYLPDGYLGTLLTAIRGAFDVERDAEVTMEANPGDLRPGKLAECLESGINRLSIGVQSFDDALLSDLGRRHSADEALEAYRAAEKAGFRNISIDLMYGLPHQTLEQWEHTLSVATELQPGHISMYCLTLEGGTPMERWVKSGRMPDPDPDLAADMYELAMRVMRPLGYRHYEISNWAVPGAESRHNLTYWRNQPYLGVGPGAHSYLAGHRFSNLKSPAEYVRRLKRVPSPLNGDETPLDKEIIAGVPPVETVELIDQPLEMAETMMMGMRLDSGIEVDHFTQRFGRAPGQVYATALGQLEDDGLLTTSNGTIKLTHRGRLLGNEVFARFFD